MRVTFTRLADHQRGTVLIERDDGVSYAMDAGPLTAEIPHDLVHYTVEDALKLSDGIWGAIAGGVVFRSMRHVGGRRPPHAAERSAALIAAYRDRLQRAEMIGGFVEAVAGAPEARLPALTRRSFASLPPADQPDAAGVAEAAAALRSAAARWKELTVGENLQLEWPAHRRLPALPPVRRRAATVTRRRSR